MVEVGERFTRIHVNLSIGEKENFVLYRVALSYRRAQFVLIPFD